MAKEKTKAKAKTKVKAKAKTDGAPKGARVNSASHMIRDLVGEGLEPAEIVKQVQKKHPDRKITMGLVNWIAADGKASGKRKAA